MSKKDEFKTRLKLAKDRIKKSEIKNDEKSSSNIGHAFKISTELLAAVIVGTIIGFILDNWFDTKPILIIVFFLFGAIAGIVNVIRAAKKMQNEDN